MKIVGNKLSVMLSVVVITMLVLSIFPVGNASVECPNTEGGVPGNRQSTTPAGSNTPVVAFGIITGPFSLTDTYIHFYRTNSAKDFSGGSPADEPFLMNQAPDGFSSANMGTWLEGFSYSDSVTCVVDRWDGTTGYTTSYAKTVPSGGGDFGTLTIEELPAPTVTGNTVTWTGMSDASVIGYMVYESNTGVLGADGWGSGDWSPVFSDPIVAINGSTGSGVPSDPQAYNTAVDTVDAYVEASGTDTHQLTDSTPSTYYVITAIYGGYGLASVSGFEWNIESLYHSAIGMGAPDPNNTIDIELRSTTGLQMIAIPGNSLGSASTAMNMAEDIEAETDMQVVYISDYEGNWNDFIYRDSNGNMMDAALHSFTDYSLEFGEGYVVSLRAPGGASDFIWETSWENRSSAVSIDLDAGWNNVGIPYDADGNYDVPNDVVDGVDITAAAAWVGNGWESGVSWSDIQTQSAGGVSQTFYDKGNAHGFFVKCPSEFTWDQSQAL